MTVKELIEQLQELNPENRVWIFTDMVNFNIGTLDIVITPNNKYGTVCIRPSDKVKEKLYETNQ